MTCRLSILFSLLIFLLFCSCQQDEADVLRKKAEQAPIEYITSNTKFGFDLSKFSLVSVDILPNQFISDILLKHGINYQKIAELEAKAKDIFSVRKIRADRDLIIVKDRECEETKSMIYEPDAFSYVEYGFQDSISISVKEKEVVSVIESASGTIETNLWNAMKDEKLDPALIDRMVDALEWSVDFYHTQKGDQFKLVYETKYVDGEAKGTGRLLGAQYKNNNDYFAIYFENEDYNGFYDEEGRPTKKAFLKAPVKFSRISSRYNMNRFHPVLKRRKAHLGTDYAAAYGTPIRAVGNGVVTKASFTRGNGRYVKIKHDDVYQTQYLHMQGFGPGIKSGVHVKQGETIGYVGSSGLATGPHVCFRFWKYGKQVDHLRENFPPPEPMKKEDLPEFFKYRDKVIQAINTVSFEQKQFPNNDYEVLNGVEL